MLRLSPRLPAAIVVLIGAPSALAQPVQRDVDDYFALAMRRARLKNLAIEAPGCSIGVNCPYSGRGNWGVLGVAGGSVPDPGQVVGGAVCGTGDFFQVFRNNVTATCGPDCSMIGTPGGGPNCENTFSAPIVGDLDLDGQPSCSLDHVVDLDDIALACGAPAVFPPCASDRPVTVRTDADCEPLVLDVAPGNMTCDLAPGAYGKVRVRNSGKLTFGAGDTVVCKLVAGKASRVTSEGPAKILVPGRGAVKFNDLADVGGECREFSVIAEGGTIRFGRHGDLNLDACSIRGKVKLGHDNNLRGRFVAGSFLTSDRNNDGRCCQGEVIVTTTTTTSTSSTPTSTSSTTTSTTTPSTTSTDPGTSSTTTSTSATTSSTSSTASSTTTTSAPSTSSTTSTTVPGAFTRTIGFYKTHPGITQSILTAAGGGERVRCARDGRGHRPRALGA